MTISFNQYITERFVTIGFKPEQEHHREKFRDQIHSIIKGSYKELDGYGGLGHGSEEEHKTIHQDISNAGTIKLVHRDGKVTAVTMYKKTHGRKLIAAGSDGSEHGKRDFMKIAIEDNLHKRSWGEFSGPLEKVLTRIGVPRLSSKNAERLLPGKKITPSPDDPNYYSRSIGDKEHQKVIMGHPTPK